MSSEKIGIKFDEKYRPKSSSDVIGNKKQIYKIKEWIENYSKNREKFFKEPKKRKKIKAIISDDEDDYDYDDVIENPDATGKSENTENHSCLIAVGDHGVGKTCTVLAVLNQLGYTAQTVNLSKIGSNKNIIENVNKIDDTNHRINSKKNLTVTLINNRY